MASADSARPDRIATLRRSVDPHERLGTRPDVGPGQQALAGPRGLVVQVEAVLATSELFAHVDRVDTGGEDRRSLDRQRMERPERLQGLATPLPCEDPAQARPGS
ncbi:MAG: hypothetical protein WKF75_05055 [Singulisphaera sp.]